MIGGGEAHRFIKDSDAIDEVQKVGMNECVEYSAVVSAGRRCHACECLKSVD